MKLQQKLFGFFHIQPWVLCEVYSSAQGYFGFSFGEEFAVIQVARVGRDPVIIAHITALAISSRFTRVS